MLLLGWGSGRFRDRLVRRHPQIADRLLAAEGLGGEELSIHLSACDLMIQPYPDGISMRRTSVMAALSHGRTVVTTVGRLTESFWTESGAVAAVPAEDAMALAPSAMNLLQNELERVELTRRARKLYVERFDLRHTIAGSRGA